MREAARRTRRANGEKTAEDRILRALVANEPEARDEAARIRASTLLIDHDYLAYWVDELGLQEQWEGLGEHSVTTTPTAPMEHPSTPRRRRGSTSR
jgi:hypothetical protein